MQGVTFERRPVDISDGFRALYDKSVDLWQRVIRAFASAKQDQLITGKVCQGPPALLAGCLVGTALVGAPGVA